MTKKFSIGLICLEEDRPQIPIKLTEYLEGFIYEHVLQPFNIIIGAKPDILLAFTLMETGDRIPGKVTVLKPQGVNGDKLYTVIIPLDQIRENNTVSKIVGLFSEGITLFFLQNYKKVKPVFIERIVSRIALPS